MKGKKKKNQGKIQRRLSFVCVLTVQPHFLLASEASLYRGYFGYFIQDWLLWLFSRTSGYFWDYVGTFWLLKMCLASLATFLRMWLFWLLSFTFDVETEGWLYREMPENIKWIFTRSSNDSSQWAWKWDFAYPPPPPFLAPHRVVVAENRKMTHYILSAFWLIIKERQHGSSCISWWRSYAWVFKGWYCSCKWLIRTCQPTRQSHRVDTHVATGG